MFNVMPNVTGKNVRAYSALHSSLKGGARGGRSPALPFTVPVTVATYTLWTDWDETAYHEREPASSIIAGVFGRRSAMSQPESRPLVRAPVGARAQLGALLRSHGLLLALLAGQYLVVQL